MRSTGMWGTQKHIAKIKKFNVALCGVKLGVFHDSELNKSICFIPLPLLDEKNATPTFLLFTTTTIAMVSKEIHVLGINCYIIACWVLP